MRCKVLICVVLLIKHASTSEIQASPNTNATLPCNVVFPLSVNGDQIDQSLIKASWISNGSVISIFENTVSQIKEGFSWDTSDFVNGGFSLTILRSSLNLQGVYECTVSFNSTMLHSSTITFGILASPILSIPQQWVVLEEPSQLSCHADAFYPPLVSFSWTRGEEVIHPPYQVMGEQTPDGYYTAVGNLTFYPSREDQNVTFGCKVSHSGNYQELHFKLNMTYLPSVRLVNVPSCSNNILCTYYCDVESFYPEEISVFWLQNGTALPEPPATEQNPDGTFRTRRYYTLSHEQREQGGMLECVVNQPGVDHPVSGSVYLEKLDLQDGPPVLTKSAKASVAMMCISIVLVFLLCFGFSWRRRDAAPEVSEIQLAEAPNDSDVISLTVQAFKFHPDVITFRWFCQGSELSPVASQASSSPRPNSEGFFSAYSQCKLPRSEVEKGGTKVWVSVHHIALKQPVTRETRGFLKSPCVSEVVSSTSSLDQTLTLGCEITDFYPPNISVTWRKLREGEQDDREEEPVEGGEMWGPMETCPRLYRATATLKRKATNQEKERGGGIICRVDHCSLQEPIERHWRNNNIVAPFIPPSISVCWTNEGVGVFSLLLKGGYPKVKLFWAAGGPTLSPLVSNETEEIGDDGQRELKSVCALERTASLPTQTNKQLERQKNGDIKTNSAVTDPDTEGIEYIDEKVDEENNSIDRDEETVSEMDEDSDAEKKEDPSALHINRVNLGRSLKENERVCLRVCVEITHPALKLPVYRIWTEPSEGISSSA
uniref:Si:ch211-180a12.2 n=1 Tax=Mastacembelus armatus TaxID=205130 RepID=A0A3Q3LZJ8_9TELE